MIDPQQYLDDLLASRPDLQRYVTKLWYVLPGGPMPLGVTHTLTLGSQASPGRNIIVGLVLVTQYAFMVEALMALIATAPPVSQ